MNSPLFANLVNNLALTKRETLARLLALYGVDLIRRRPSYADETGAQVVTAEVTLRGLVHDQPIRHILQLYDVGGLNLMDSAPQLFLLDVNADVVETDEIVWNATVWDVAENDPLILNNIKVLQKVRVIRKRRST